MHPGWERADCSMVRQAVSISDGEVMAALQPRFAPAIRQVHRLVSEIPALRKEFSLLLAKQSHLTSPVIKMCQSFDRLLALTFILICCTSQSTMPDFSTVKMVKNDPVPKASFHKGEKLGPAALTLGL